jgi:hypothetical protein
MSRNLSEIRSFLEKIISKNEDRDICRQLGINFQDMNKLTGLDFILVR